MNKQINPSVSVVTPSYNHARFLPERVASILNQTLDNFEWIIIDDCSTDGSQDLLRELVNDDPRVVLIFHPRNVGMPSTTREAIELSSGKYIYRAESDDVCDIRFLEKMVKVMEGHPEVGFCYCRSLHMDHEGTIWGGWRQEKEDRLWKGQELFKSIVMGTSISGGNILFSKAAHDSVGGFGIGPFRIACDWHFCLRLCLKYDTAYLKEPLGYHRDHQDNLSGMVGRNLDYESVFRESYHLLDDVFEHVVVEAPELGKLQREAIRCASHRIAGLYIRAIFTGQGVISRKIIEGIELHDPGATKGLEWIKAVIYSLFYEIIYGPVYTHFARLFRRRLNTGG